MRNLSISHYDDVIDSRDVIARIEELESEAQDASDHIAECEEELAVLEAEEEHTIEDGDRIAALRQGIENSRVSEEDAEELKILQALAKEGADYAAGWQHGATMIRDSYFETYAEELASDIGAIDSKAGWPLMHIDWEAAADSLKQDYTSLDFDGVEYWVRS